jgi:hypothetical protein
MLGLSPKRPTVNSNEEEGGSLLAEILSAFIHNFPTRRTPKKSFGTKKHRFSFIFSFFPVEETSRVGYLILKKNHLSCERLAFWLSQFLELREGLVKVS